MVKYRADGWAGQADGSHVLTCPNGKQYRLHKEGREWILTNPTGGPRAVGEGIGGAKDAAELLAVDADDLNARDLRPT